jgi:exodeoxyribonuclease VII small subunit
MKTSAKNDFENVLLKLEQIVQELEKGEIPLSESINKFEEGIELYEECRDFLSKAEQKIKVLTESLKEENLTSNE